MTNTHTELRSRSRPPFVILGQQAFSEAVSAAPFHDDLDEEETPTLKLLGMSLLALVSPCYFHISRFQYTYTVIHLLMVDVSCVFVWDHAH